MRADVVNPTLINIIQKGASLGSVVIGLLTDEAICSYTRPPQLSYSERESVLKYLKNIDKIIPQDSLDCSNNLLKLKPDILLHGDDWKDGFQSQIRKKVIKTLNQWGGKVIEVPYDIKNNQSKINKMSSQLGTTPEKRRVTLRKLLAVKDITRITKFSLHNITTSNTQGTF